MKTKRLTKRRAEQIATLRFHAWIGTFDGHTTKEIAEEYGVSRATVLLALLDLNNIAIRGDDSMVFAIGEVDARTGSANDLHKNAPVHYYFFTT